MTQTSIQPPSFFFYRCLTCAQGHGSAGATSQPSEGEKAAPFIKGPTQRGEQTVRTQGRPVTLMFLRPWECNVQTPGRARTCKPPPKADALSTFARMRAAVRQCCLMRGQTAQNKPSVLFYPSPVSDSPLPPERPAIKTKAASIRRKVLVTWSLGRSSRPCRQVMEAFLCLFSV